MRIAGYNLDFKEAIAAIKQKGYKTIVLQVPEGLKMQASVFADFLEEKTQATIIISGDPCFGACDTANYKFYNHEIDLIIQIGHTHIPYIESSSIPTIFINALADVNVLKSVKKSIKLLKGKKVGLISTAQHVHLLDEAKKLLVYNKFEPFIGKGDSRIDLKGQILGCNFSAAKSIANEVDTFLFIGSGNFHPLGLLLLFKKQVIVCDPYSNEVREKELQDLKDMILRQRYGAIARSKDAHVFGILIGTKLGQQRIELAYEIKEKLNFKQKKSYIFSLNHFSPIFLEGYRDIDCFVSTACPRIAIDDYMQYKVPIITPIELDILLDFKKWEEYQFDEILL